MHVYNKLVTEVCTVFSHELECNFTVLLYYSTGNTIDLSRPWVVVIVVCHAVQVVHLSVKLGVGNPRPEERALNPAAMQ